MMRLWALVIALLLVAVASAPASARIFKQEVDVTNHTTKCAWITIYGSYEGEPNYYIAPGANERPRWLKPGERHVFAGGLLSKGINDIRIRAEVKANADCSGSNIGDTDLYMHSVSYGGGMHKRALWKGTGNGWYFQ